jgi:hypothetical protein
VSSHTQPETTTAPGLHDFLLEEVLPRYFRAGERAIDLGTGSGALPLGLQEAGWDVIAADVNAPEHKARGPFVGGDCLHGDNHVLVLSRNERE